MLLNLGLITPAAPGEKLSALSGIDVGIFAQRDKMLLRDNRSHLVFGMNHFKGDTNIDCIHTVYLRIEYLSCDKAQLITPAKRQKTQVKPFLLRIKALNLW